jgi:hypothetical protein
MNEMLHHVARFLALALLVTLPMADLPAQGPPVSIDTCVVGVAMRFKSFPVPSKFVRTDYEALNVCADFRNNLVKLPKAKIGKVGNLKVFLRFTDGKLAQVSILSSGEKGFKKLYKQVVKEAGTPNKMVESRGMLTYTWGVRSKFKAALTLHYVPETTAGTVSILP